MDIIVEGKASEFFTPDEVKFNINFWTKEKTYNSALSEGTKSVEKFINEILIGLGLTKRDLKTKSFVISEETKYNDKTKVREPDGYAYRQTSFIKFEYDMKKISKFMDEVSKLKNPPSYRISFSLKDEKGCKNEVIAKAYNEAKIKAEAIALASGKKLKDCVKVDFRPFDEHVISNSGIEKNMMYMEKSMGSAQVVENVFTPEDVEIVEKLYCLWITD